MVAVERSLRFTSVEFMVIVAIVLMVVTMLIPAFHRARAKAIMEACESNLRQIGAATRMYAEDSNEFFPKWMGWNGGKVRQKKYYSYRWAPKLAAYKGITKDVFSCPARERSSFKWPMPEGWDIKINYGYCGLGKETPREASYSLATVRHPELSVVAADCAHAEDGQSKYRLAYARYCRTGCDAASRTVNNTVHDGGSNLVFVDGHAAHIRAQELISGWGRTYRAHASQHDDP